MGIFKDEKYKRIILILLIPVVLVAQYYLFKFGILKPMIKGLEIQIVNGEYIQDIDKFVIKAGRSVTLSGGEYIKLPEYAKDPEISFKILDNNKVLQIIENNAEENTATLVGLKEGYSSIALVKNSRVIKKATVLVVDPKVESLDMNVNGSLVFVGDSATIDSSIEVDYKRFNDSYEVTYESSNEDILSIEGNKVRAVGVGRATIYAKSGDKIDAIRYSINAKVASMKVDKEIKIEVGQRKKIKPTIITSPKGLKHPTIEYQLVENKLPIERALSLESDGTITGLIEGEEKILVSCGIGKNKKIEIINVSVVKTSLENKFIKDLLAIFEISDNKGLINLTWSSLEDIYKYDIYIKNNLNEKSEYNLAKSIIMDKIDLDNTSKIKSTLEVDLGNLKEIDYDIYVVGVTDKGNTGQSNIVRVEHNISDLEHESINISSNIDIENKKIDLSWNALGNSKYNVYVKDISKGDTDFKLYQSDLTEPSCSIRFDEDLDLEVYVVSIVDENEKVKSDIKVFK